MLTRPGGLPRDLVVGLAWVQGSSDRRLEVFEARMDAERKLPADGLASSGQLVQRGELVAQHGGHVEVSAWLVQGPQSFGTVGV